MLLFDGDRRFTAFSAFDEPLPNATCTSPDYALPAPKSTPPTPPTRSGSP